MSPFDGCRKRIERAYAHREALGKIWNDIVHEDLYRVVVDMQRDGTGAIALEQINPLPVSCSFELGETLYNFRAALDECVYRAAIIQSGQDPPPGESRLEFPICFSADDFRKAAWKIEPLSQKCRDFIELMQPYSTPKLPSELYIRTLTVIWGFSTIGRERTGTGSFMLSALGVRKPTPGFAFRAE